MRSRQLILLTLLSFLFLQGYAKRTIVVNNNNPLPGECASISLALDKITNDAAVSGIFDDYILYLKPSPNSYGNIDESVMSLHPMFSPPSSKKLVIIGGGWNDGVLGASNTSKLGYIDVGSVATIILAGLDITGFVHSNQFISLYRCRIGGYIETVQGYLDVYGCVALDNILAGAGVGLYNNIITPSDRILIQCDPSYPDKIYNNFINPLSIFTLDYIPFSGWGQLELKNNIFSNYGAFIDPPPVTSSTNYIISYNFITIPEVFTYDNGNNNTDFDPGFVSVQPSVAFDPLGDYHLIATSVCKTDLGSDGTERGIYGGGGGTIPVLNVNVSHWFSMTGELPIPTVTQMTVTPNTVIYGNNTNVNVHVVSKLPH